MEDTFKVRVDRIFGSLDSPSVAAPSPGSSSLRSLWSLTDDVIDPKERSNDKDGAPESETDGRFNGEASVEEITSGDLEELEDDLEELGDDAEPSGLSEKPDDYDEEEWEIKSSIGRDCTLDFEEEEDSYDKVAVGREKAGDRLYMKDASDYGIDIDSGKVSSSFGDADRDPRANHVAATLRLKEDAEAAGKVESMPASVGTASSAGNSLVCPTEDDANLKSILKFKDGRTDSKKKKRVRFDPEFVEKAPVDSEDIEMETEEAGVAREVTVPARDFSSAVPDYIRNPSKYTHYTFDSTEDDVDEQANRQAYMDFLNTVRKSKGIEDEAPAELPKSVTFVPQKKKSDASEGVGLQDKEEITRQVPGGQKRAFPISIPAEDIEEEVEAACAMDEEEREPAANVRSGSKRPSRHYRARATLEDDDSD